MTVIIYCDSTASWCIEEALPIDSYSSEFTDIKLFPNPTSGIIKLRFSSTAVPECEVSITDMSGRKLKSELCISNEGTVLDFSDLQKGMYLLELSINNKRLAMRKVVIN